MTLQKQERAALWHAVDSMALMLKAGRELMTEAQYEAEAAKLKLARRALKKLYAKDAE